MSVTHLAASGPAPQHGALLRAAVAQLRGATRLPVAFGGTVPSAGRDVRLTAFAGTRTDALHGLLIRAGNGLGGQVLLTARAGSVDDYAADARISHEYDKPVTVEGLRAIAAVPVVVGASVSGVLYGGVREPLPLGDRVLDAMTQIAMRVGVELAVRAEVERRLAELETAAIIQTAREAPTTPEWEDVREAHAELRSIAQEVADGTLRRRLEVVCERLTGSGHRPARANPLSPREMDVLALVAVGCANAEVGRRLGLLPETVKSYLRNTMRKLGTHTRAETVVAARRAGFLP